MYTNGAFGTDKSALFMDVSSIQGCPYRGVLLYRSSSILCKPVPDESITCHRLVAISIT